MLHNNKETTSKEDNDAERRAIRDRYLTTPWTPLSPESPEDLSTSHHSSSNPGNTSLKHRLLTRPPPLEINPPLPPTWQKNKPSTSTSARSNDNNPPPAHFTVGSLIQLSNGELKRVEELVTEDFIRSAEFSQDVRIDHSTVVGMEISSNESGGTVTLSFHVGKQKIQVIFLKYPFGSLPNTHYIHDNNTLGRVRI